VIGTCHFCGRGDVEFTRRYANQDGESWHFDTGEYLVTLSGKPICVDCANVAAHFVKKGLRAFRESLENSRQLDLFPAEKLVNES
jgi:hypothetical protein